jgi:hypothetical protein
MLILKIIFSGRYKLINVRTRRVLHSRGGNYFTGERGLEGGVSNANYITGASADYYSLGSWKILYQGEGNYIIENYANKRYLYSEGDEIPGDCGCEGGVAEAPPCLESHANYDNRALWKIIQQEEGKYLIQSVVNFRYVYSQGEPVRETDSGYSASPRCVMSDANYDDRALWEIH